ncbi:MAG: acyl-CoA/acyl-ACP dehydrogenase [Deltaproteobacteria bacterium]|nr:acyl-CoA/acyl-ACP dehydrogenase [Deltaproteobacteria bacterium]
MDYDLSEEQKMMKQAARKFLSKECPSEFVRKMAEDEKGYTPELWKGMADLGWMGLLLPEEYGGFGGQFLDLAVLLSEMGYSCLPGPFFSSAVLGGLTLVKAGNQEQKTKILPELAAGERLLTLSLVEQDGTCQPEGINLDAKPQGDRYILNGTKLFVPDAHVADTIICVARTDKATTDPSRGLTLFLVDAKTPGVRIELLNTMAGDKSCEVVFDQVAVPKDKILGESGRAWAVLDPILKMAAVAKSAEMSGVGERVMDLAIPWIKERVQFGRPVGAFQAVQHHCANMLTYLDTMRFMTYQAAWRISADLPFDREASACKAWVGDACRSLVGLGHQVMGGVGFMEEHDLQLYFKRANAAAQMFGDTDFHREIVAREMGL